MVFPKAICGLDADATVVHQYLGTFTQSPKKVTGRVMDAQGELLIGVNVTEAADPSNGVVTDITVHVYDCVEGNEPSLKFSYIGFKDKVVAVGSKGVLDVALEEDVAALDEVVVVGFGTQKKASVVGSITNIEPAKLAAAPAVRQCCGGYGSRCDCGSA